MQNFPPVPSIVRGGARTPTSAERGGGSGSEGGGGGRKREVTQESDSALLLLVHIPGVFGIVTLVTLPFLFLITTVDDARFKQTRAISFFTCILAVLFVAWVIYAIQNTLLRNNVNPTPTFGTFGFRSLQILTGLLGVLAVWLLVVVVN